MNRDKWNVIPDDIRPAGPSDRCFYCGAKLGGQHAHGCAIRSRTVVVRTTIEHVIEVPEDWGADMIEFSRNDSSRCHDNDIQDLQAMVGRLNANGMCSCHMVATEFLREATAEDEQSCAWPRGDRHQAA